jgi:hypothetical protein
MKLWLNLKRWYLGTELDAEAARRRETGAMQVYAGSEISDRERKIAVERDAKFVGLAWWG